MKKIYFVFLVTILATAVSYAQTYRSYVKSTNSDPAIENLFISNTNGGLANAGMLDNDKPVKLQFTLTNYSISGIVPAGSCRIMLTLGTKFTMATNLNDIQNLPLSNYFKWMLRQAPDSRQYILFGLLEHDLPAKFSADLSFMLMPSKLGSSTIVSQLLVSNEKNPNNTLSDENPNNNFASVSYTNVKPFDALFLKFSAQPRSCNIDLRWSVQDKNTVVKQFVIETSNDGVAFNSVQTIAAATNTESYSYLLEKIEKSTITVRIKAESEIGQFLYSENIFVENICNTGFAISAYPNPMPALVTELTLQAKTGIFNGKYSITLSSANGGEVKRFEETYSNQVQVKLKIGTLPAGIYFITLTGEDKKQSIVKLAKL
jgi:hypothetical protein